MRRPATVWIYLIGSLILAAVLMLVKLVTTRLGGATARTPTPVTQGPVATAVAVAVDPSHGLHWNDPSLEPSILERAFPPPPNNLPPEAMPRASNIHPPQEDLRRLQRNGAVTY